MTRRNSRRSVIIGNFPGLSAIPDNCRTDLELLPLIQEIDRELFERMTIMA
ncbi:hypothetical protein [Desulfococcus sp.]|uniref:hypothetical protein n=1 Tax=Desulfococcus sp. TaxID=2025834 RepID=UPI0035936144